MIITFVKPFYLVFLFVIPAMIFLHFLTMSFKKRRALAFANFQAIARIQGIEFYSKHLIILLLHIGIASVLIFALAGTTVHQVLPASSFSFVVAIDTSKSMEANDFLPTRLDAAKDAAIEFVNDAPIDTQIGVISFSGNAFIEHDITSDKDLLKESIQGIPLSSIGGTDLYEAVVTSSNLLVGQNGKAIVLVSDGRINIGSIDSLIDYATKRDVVVNTIGIGTEQGGETEFGLSTIDEDSLQAIAYNTHGTYHRVKTSGELHSAFQEMYALKEQQVSIPLATYLVLIGLCLFLLEFILLNTHFIGFP